MRQILARFKQKARMDYAQEVFRRVYQGGHHDVYCNGTAHVWLSGDAFGSAPLTKARVVARIRRGQCDCAQWK